MAQMTHAVTQDPTGGRQPSDAPPPPADQGVSHLTWVLRWRSQRCRHPNLFFPRNESGEPSNTQTIEFCSSAIVNEEVLCGLAQNKLQGKWGRVGSAVCGSVYKERFLPAGASLEGHTSHWQRRWPPGGDGQAGSWAGRSTHCDRLFCMS